MSRLLPRPAARLLPGPAALVLALAVSGCGANFQAQTYQERTVADGTNVAVGAIAVRNVSVAPPADGGVYETGEDAEVAMTVTNDGGEDDRLVSASSPAATSVDLVDTRTGRTVSSVDVPRLGTTGNGTGLRLRSLTQPVRVAEYVEVTLRFERNGEVTVQVPVATTNEYDYEREKSANFHPPGTEGGEGAAGGEGGSLREASEDATADH